MTVPHPVPQKTMSTPNNTASNAVIQPSNSIAVPRLASACRSLFVSTDEPSGSVMSATLVSPAAATPSVFCGLPSQSGDVGEVCVVPDAQFQMTVASTSCATPSASEDVSRSSIVPHAPVSHAVTVPAVSCGEFDT
ncbi:uncharacterized protein LOC135372180 [Ornithodoros turicata]|uniref:uncharacterized protein LOC135372180 n=1 Tax=Ornithodoros turicata TaxID=34597 RepID=UPI0031394699